jgi:hypothetical protein
MKSFKLIILFLLIPTMIALACFKRGNPYKIFSIVDFFTEEYVRKHKIKSIKKQFIKKGMVKNGNKVRFNKSGQLTFFSTKTHWGLEDFFLEYDNSKQTSTKHYRDSMLVEELKFYEKKDGSYTKKVYDDRGNLISSYNYRDFKIRDSLKNSISFYSSMYGFDKDSIYDLNTNLLRIEYYKNGGKQKEFHPGIYGDLFIYYYYDENNQLILDSADNSLTTYNYKNNQLFKKTEYYHRKLDDITYYNQFGLDSIRQFYNDTLSLEAENQYIYDSNGLLKMFLSYYHVEHKFEYKVKTENLGPKSTKKDTFLNTRSFEKYIIKQDQNPDTLLFEYEFYD